MVGASRIGKFIDVEVAQSLKYWINLESSGKLIPLGVAGQPLSQLPMGNIPTAIQKIEAASLGKFSQRLP